MARRTKHQQSKHDRGVQKSAEYYESHGFRVKADIKGYDAPPAIKKRRPDIFAQKGKKKVIVEVETKDSVTKDKSQNQTFRDYVGDKRNVRYWRKVV